MIADVGALGVNFLKHDIHLARNKLWVFLKYSSVRTDPKPGAVIALQLAQKQNNAFFCPFDRMLRNIFKLPRVYQPTTWPYTT